MHRRNVPWGFGDIAEHVADLADTRGERPVADVHVWPHSFHEGGATHEAVRVFDQIAQHGTGFGCELAPLRAAPQAVVSAIEGERAKVQGRTGPHGRSREDATAIS